MRITASAKNELWKLTGEKCYYCDCELLPFGNEKNSFAVDYIIPLKMGGTRDIENLLPSCKSCNKKGAK